MIDNKITHLEAECYEQYTSKDYTFVNATGNIHCFYSKKVVLVNVLA